MSKPNSNRIVIAGINAGGRARTGNDRAVRTRNAQKKRENSVVPADCHIDTQIMEVDVFDLSAVRREVGAHSARLFAAVDDISLAVKVERPGRKGAPWQQLGSHDGVLSPPVGNSTAFQQIVKRLNTSFGRVIESSRVMQEASEKLTHGMEKLRAGIGEIKDAADEYKLDRN